MDDLIYILLGIAWIIYAAYRVNQKQKKRPPAQSQSQSEPQNTYEQSPRPIETIFREILGEDESLERQFIPESESYDEVVVRELEQEKKLYSRPKTSLESIPLEEGVSAFDYSKGYPKQQMIFSEEDSSAAIPREYYHFDLRKAVIYSAILNRPYQ